MFIERTVFFLLHNLFCLGAPLSTRVKSGKIYPSELHLPQSDIYYLLYNNRYMREKLNSTVQDVKPALKLHSVGKC